MQNDLVSTKKKVGRKRVSEATRHLVLESVSERDIDLMLVEEIVCSRAFQRLLFNTVANPSTGWVWSEAVSIRVRHSVAHKGFATAGRLVPPSGETDIEVLFEFQTSDTTSQRLLLLIENKIEAAFMPRQPDRYLARASFSRDSGEYTDARTLITAPAAYLQATRDVAQFHAMLSYEDIAAHFAERATDSSDAEAMRRYRQRRETIEHAIGRYRRGYRQVTHPGVKDFRHAYHRHAAAVAPGLKLQTQFEHHWAGDEWMEYRHALSCGAHSRAEIIHKLPQGTVDLQLYGWGEQIDAVQPRVRRLLEDGMYIVPPNKRTKSLIIIIPAPAVFPQRPFRAQVWKAELGMKAAERLQAWYHRQGEALEAIGVSALGIQ